MQLVGAGFQLVGSTIVDEIVPLKNGVPPVGAMRFIDNSAWREMPSEVARKYPECLRDFPRVFVVETLVDVAGYRERVALTWRRDVFVESPCLAWAADDNDDNDDEEVE